MSLNFLANNFYKFKNLFFAIIVILVTYDSALGESIPLIWNIPAKNNYFTGRKDLLHELDKDLHKHHRITLVGSGGIGKTQITKRFAYDNLSKYKILWWFDMTNNIDDQLILFANSLNKANIGYKIDTNKVSANAILLHVKEVLRKTDKSWLIVFDNAKNTDEVSKLFPESHNSIGKDIIVTSRNANTDMHVLQIKPFNLNDSILYMQNTIGENSDQDLKQLAEILNGYPIAIAQAAVYIRTNNIKTSEYISLLETDPGKLAKDEHVLLSTESNYFDLNKKTIEATLDLNLQNLINESKKAFEIIQIVSFINRPEIPEGLLFEFVSTNTKIDKEIFNRGIRALKKHSLIEESEKEGIKYYSCHDLIKKITKIYTLSAQNSFKDVYQKLLLVMLSYFDKPWGDIVDFVNDNTELINIAHAITFSAYKDKIVDSRLAMLSICLLEHNNMMFHFKNNYSIYQNLSEKTLRLIQQRSFNLPINYESRYYSVAIYTDFIFKNKATLKNFSDKLNKLHSKLITMRDFSELNFLTTICLAEFCLFKGDLAGAEKYINLASATLSDIKNQNYQLLFWYASAWIEKEKGNYTNVYNSTRNFFKSNKIMKKYPIHLFTLNLKAVSEMHLGNYNTACKTAHDVYNSSLEYFHSNNSDIAAESLITLAKCDIVNKNSKNAEQKINLAINIMNSVFGAHDIDLTQAVAHTMLGEINMLQEKYQNAYDEYKFAERYYYKVYGDRIPDSVDVGILFSNLAILGIKIHDKIMIKQYLSKLVDIFTYDNFYTKKVIQELINSKNKNLL